MSAEHYQTISYSVDHQVALITMNRPEVMNAVNATMRNELMDAINLALAADNIRVIVLTGAGPGFCVGQDLVEGEVSGTVPGKPSGEQTRRLLEEEYKPLILAIDQSEKLVMAAVNGPAAGIGCSLALACDLVVMADNAYFYQAFVAIGLIPDGGACWQLVQQLGYRRALELVIEGSKLLAQECVALGLANRVVSADTLSDESMKWAKRLAQKAPLAIASSKSALKQAQHIDLEKTVALEAQLQAEITETDDALEGIKAFIEKRKPVFKGQ